MFTYTQCPVICSKDENTSVRINVRGKNLSAFKIVAGHETQSSVLSTFASTAGDPL